ncbi:MAG: DnaJ C-terminal domain-containing protein [Aquiluna sp.]|nr:J domain-containing protein [Actinomycetota bacterium]NCW28962.1 J domain-containing protein [Actinomycetota bacterium]NCW41692.1 J domain-containing protein [Actinomycetota bacterium]NCX63838.1 J domain-containing protein [Actinomycetota bacterium]NDA12808.1 J domain-containing protein [Actinomycetota bacterium]
MASQDWIEKDFYKILGVSKDVSDADLKKAYRKLAKDNHPDLHPGDAAAEARFKDISEAYDVLSDAEQRREYDAIRAMGGGARFQAGGQGAGFEDVFSNLFGGGGFQGGGFPGFGGFGGFGPQRGQDLSTTASINFIDSVNGTTVKLNLRNESVSVKVPAGIQDGQKLKVKGKGQPSPNGGPAGDLVVTIKVKPHAVFTRDGDNIRVSVPVTYAEATLGATIEVPVLGGDPVKLKVAAGTPNGRTLRVKGKGVQFGSRQGDLLATVEVMVPGHLPAKARKLLEQFDAELPDENPRQDLISRAGTL